VSFERFSCCPVPTRRRLMLSERSPPRIRWSEFHGNYLLPRHVDDIVEAALTAQLAIENGALNPARRELRYMLEVSVNIAYVDEVKAKESYDDRTKFYRGKGVNKSNVDHVFDLPLRLLGDHKASFATAVRDAWIKGSNYVHLTKRRIDEKLHLRDQGVARLRNDRDAEASCS
jgi:hypothetical protein